MLRRMQASAVTMDASAWRTRAIVRVRVALLLTLCVAPLAARRLPAQPRTAADQYDEAFRKYAKRSFGPGVDWRVFKAQGMAESNLDATAQSRVGARGVMQLMPVTFREIASKNPELERIDDPVMNIAAGIAYDHRLWVAWANDSVTTDCLNFMLASYNAGRGTLLGAQRTARDASLDPRLWPSIEAVAPRVPRWRHVETLQYVRRIASNMQSLDDRGRVMVDGVSTRGLRK